MAFALARAAAIEIRKLLESSRLQQPVASLQDSSELQTTDWHLYVGIFHRSDCEEIEVIGGIPFAWGPNMELLNSYTLEFQNGTFILRREGNVFSSLQSALNISAT